MMSNPFDYQKKMYAYFWKGENPEEDDDNVELKPVSDTQAPVTAQEAIGGAIPRGAWDEMEELRARARALQAAPEVTE